MYFFSSATVLVIKLFFGFFLFTLIVRFLMQLVRADYTSPIAHFIVKITDPVLRPFRRVIPGIMGIDLASVVVILLVQLVELILINLLPGRQLPGISVLLLLTVGEVIASFITIYFICIFASVLASWIAQGSYNPVLYLIHQIIEPLMGRIRRLIPPMSGLDISPLIAIAILIFAYFLIAAQILYIADPMHSYQ
ncbi:MAG: YggT family protein [Gammaproteobacteria bacterium]|nr:MAG: YggT family protein [Gammaproteobacteria bacterium]